MRQGFRVLVFGMVILVLGGLAFADQVTVGAISYDPFILGQPGLPAVNVFDLSNLTGMNSFPPDFPVATNLDFNNLTLTVFDSGGGQQSFDGGTFGPGFATLDAQFLDTLGITSAILTGSFSSTAITLADGSSVQINQTFSSTILPSSGLTLVAGADSAVIYATTSTTAVPEPNSLTLLAMGILLTGILLGRRVFRCTFYNDCFYK